MIPFNRPYLTGHEMEFVREAAESGHICGNGAFTHRCQDFFARRYGFGTCLLTTSCTDALEMAAILTGVGPGDEVIVPSYTFVSTALAFVRTGATVVFADSRADEPNIDVGALEALVTPRTKALAVVHYAGCACDMDAVMAFADRHGLLVVEDAAQAVDAYYTGADGVKRALGSIGHFAAFSFHETKNVSAGEAGLLVVNDARFAHRAEIVWEKGTNRAEFVRGEVNKYGWVDTGSSFLPTELVAAYLAAQLEGLDEIQRRRLAVWTRYRDFFAPRADALGLSLPVVPPYATHNAHVFYMLLPDLARRTRFIADMKEAGVQCSSHYVPLHSSAYYAARHGSRALPNCDRYADTLVRLPLYAGLEPAEQDQVMAAVEKALRS